MAIFNDKDERDSPGRIHGTHGTYGLQACTGNPCANFKDTGYSDDREYQNELCFDNCRAQLPLAYCREAPGIPCMQVH